MFKATDFDSLQAVIGAAEELNKPVIIAHAEVHNVFNDISMVGPVMVAVAQNAKVPVCVHLDHGESFEICKEQLSEEHPLSILVLSNLAAAIYQAKADADTAIELLNHAFALREKTGLLYHPDNISLLETLGAIYLRKSRINEYIDTLNKLYAVCRATLGEEHPKTVKTKAILDKINKRF